LYNLGSSMPRLCPYRVGVLEMNKSLQNLVTAVTKGKGLRSSLRLS
ncbi:hypothetical protein Tco_0050206, partial [Tanacetum coccineum]